MAPKMIPISEKMPEEMLDDETESEDTESEEPSEPSYPESLPELEEATPQPSEEPEEESEEAEEAEEAEEEAEEAPAPEPEPAPKKKPAASAAAMSLTKERALMLFAEALLDHAATDRPSLQQVEAKLKAWSEIAYAEESYEQKRAIEFSEAHDEPQAVREANYRTFVQDREAILQRWISATHAQRYEISRELTALEVPESIKEGVMTQRLFTRTVMK